MINLERLSIELKKCYPYLDSWKRKQNDEWDKKTRFIYDCRQFSLVQNKIQQEFGSLPAQHEWQSYALHRWYNFWSAKGIEQIFIESTNVKENNDPYHKTIDFWIDDIPFDHKTTVFPKTIPFSIEEIKTNPIKLIDWLYQNQSREQRFHLQNRLFIVLIDKNGKHQRLRSEIRLIQENIEQYLRTFSEIRLSKLILNQQQIYTDCIFVED